MPNNSDIETLVIKAAGTGSPEAMDLLRREADPGKVLSQLAKSRSLDVRGWVVVAAHEVLGAAASPLLIALLEDPDPDIRVLAMSSIEELDPTAIARLAGRLRLRLRSSNPYEALATSWALARVGDRNAVPVLEEYRDSFESWRWQHKAAEVVLLYISDPDEVIRRVRSHDHDRMGWLAHAATLIGSPDAIAALRECSTSAPDPECRGLCSIAFEHDD